MLGAGAWGTALADLLSRGGHVVTLWSHEPGVTQAIIERRENPYLPGVAIDVAVGAQSGLAPTLEDAELVVSATPSQFVRDVMARAAKHLMPSATVVSASKGIELTTRLRMAQVIADSLGPGWRGSFAVLSGPSFAKEVAAGIPTAVVVASREAETANEVQRSFQAGHFRIYTSTDVVGVEISGALKNVMALAAGISVGLGHGHNTIAALVSRGLAEMVRLGVAMGAEPTTFAGLAGMGDLLLTCTGTLSRNRAVGIRLGRGEPLASILDGMTAVAEGVRTAEAVHQLARSHGVEMPIAEQVYAIVHDGRDPKHALRELMERAPKPEDW